MKVNNNDYSNKSIKDIKRINLNKKCNNSSSNKTNISSPKFKPIKNLKKNINNVIKNKYNFKKSFDSKLSLKQSIKRKSISNNHKLIIPQCIKYNQKTIEVTKKSKIIIKNKENYSKNKDYHSNDIIKSHVNKSFNNISKKTKESKLVNSLSTSSGLSLYSNKNKKYSHFADSENNNHKINYNVDSHSIEKNNMLLEENKQNINNFSYETISKEDDLNENKIILKCDNYSLLTFGNSFSYSNSQRSKSTKKYLNNDKNNNNEINIVNNDENKNSCFNLISQYNINNNYVNKLKEENETLRKELKESNDQITFLMYQINELKQNKNYKSKKFLKNKISPPNIWDKRKMKFESSDKENYNRCNNNDNNKSSFDKKNNEIKNNKNLLKYDNVIKNVKNKSKKEKIKINKRINIDNSKLKSMHSSNYVKPSEKIFECISKIKI